MLHQGGRLSQSVHLLRHQNLIKARKHHEKPSLTSSCVVSYKIVENALEVSSTPAGALVTGLSPALFPSECCFFQSSYMVGIQPQSLLSVIPKVPCSEGPCTLDPR